MEASREFKRFWTSLFGFSILAFLFIHCDARKSMLLFKDISHPKKPNVKHLKILELAKNLNMVMDVSLKESSNPQPYVSSPFTLPPYDSLAPIPLPDNNSPPYCIYPPPNPQSPSSTIPSPSGSIPTPPLPSSSSPTLPVLSPPPGPIETAPSAPETSPNPNPPAIVPGPPIIIPEPPESFPSPSISAPNPPYYEPSPPSGNIPSPPEYIPSPIGFAPSPPVFQPPVVYPPPIMPRSPSTGSGGPRVWCVAKPTVPDPIIQEAMNYACGSGADCSAIQPSGSCYQPNTLLAHASYVFNSYWQRTRVAGGTCEFGGTAMLVTVDPSSDGCHFVNY